MWDECDSKFILYNFDDESMELQYSIGNEDEWFDYDTSKARVNSLLALCRMLDVSWMYKYK